MKSKKYGKDGNLALLYLILYSFVRIFIEHLRIDSVCYIFGYPVAMVVSAGIIVLSLLAIVLNIKYRKEL